MTIRKLSSLSAVIFFFLVFFLVAAPQGFSETEIVVACGVTPPSLHNLYIHVAVDKGFFEKEGLKVKELLQVRGGPLATQAVVSGHADVTASDAHGVLAAAVAGHPVKAVSAPGARLSYMISVQKDINSLNDLVGKPFAVSRPGAMSQYLLFPALDAKNIDRNSIKWLSVGGGRERMLALVAGRVSGALLHIDYAVKAETEPNIKVLMPVASYAKDFPFEMTIVRDDMIKNNPKAVTGIVKALINACRFIVTNKDETLQVLEKYTGITDRALVESAYDKLISINGYGVNGGMTKKNLTVAMELAVENKSLKAPVPLSKWSDFRFQEEAMKELGKF